MPRVPKVTPKALRNPLLDLASEHAGCPESQPGSHPFETSFRNPFQNRLRSTTRVPECRSRDTPLGCCARVPRVPNPHREPTPEASECAASPASDISPEASECDTCPEYPKPGESLRMSPELATCPKCPSRETPPGCFPSAPRVSRAHTERSPRALGEHATCLRECFLFRRILENTRKCLKLCKIIEIRVLVRKIPNQFSQLAFDDT